MVRVVICSRAPYPGDTAIGTSTVRAHHPRLQYPHISTYKMRSYTALLLVLPALVVGHPLQRRATAESNVAENESTTDLNSSGTDTAVSAPLTSASAASEISGGQTSELPTSTSASPAEESSAAETGMSSSASSASASPVGGGQVSATTTAYGSESLSSMSPLLSERTNNVLTMLSWCCFFDCVECGSSIRYCCL